MPNDTGHNGWSNYATWRVNLEIFDAFNPFEHLSDLNQIASFFTKTSHAARVLQDHAEEVLFECATVEGLAADYARAFLADVNWYEIAEHLIDAYREEAV